MIFLLDSTIIIDALNQRRGRPNLLRAFTLAGDFLAASTISIGEVYAGLRSGEELRTAELFSSFQILPVTEQIARRAGMLKNEQARKGRTLGLLDMMIAATAIQYRLSLLTDNCKHFDLPELTLYPLP